MKTWISCIGIAALALAAQASWARGVRAQVIIGPIGPWMYYPAPVYYPPAYAVAPQVVVTPPTVYIEQNPAQMAPNVSPAPSAPPASYYFCPDSKTYYPYVQHCASAWQRVAPRPPGVPPQ